MGTKKTRTPKTEQWARSARSGSIPFSACRNTFRRPQSTLPLWQRPEVQEVLRKVISVHSTAGTIPILQPTERWKILKLQARRPRTNRNKCCNAGTGSREAVPEPIPAKKPQRPGPANNTQKPISKKIENFS